VSETLEIASRLNEELNAPFTLTQEQIDLYADNGYVKLKGVSLR